jgi:hypothetical protein
MPINKQVYLLRFFPPDSLGRLPLRERAGSIRSYFARCMGQIRPLLGEIEVLSSQEHLLSAALQGPESSYTSLKHHLEQTHLGELIHDDSIEFFGAAGPAR